MSSDLQESNPIYGLAREIVKIINDGSSFSKQSEKRVKADLVSAYRTVAEKYELGHEIEARGMTSRLGAALSGGPWESYLVFGEDGPELEIWVNADKRVQVTVEEGKLEVGEELKKILETFGIKVTFRTSSEKKVMVENYRKMLKEANDVWDFRH